MIDIFPYRVLADRIAKFRAEVLVSVPANELLAAYFDAKEKK